MALLNNLFGYKKDIKPSKYSENDFSEGLTFTEYINGKADTDNSIVIYSSFMPKESIETGITQNIKKEYYAGSPIPSVQVLGYTEDDTELKGSFDESLLNSEELAGAAEAYDQAFKELVKRGNIVKVSLGTYFVKYVIIESAKFTLFNLRKIDYNIKISIIGDQLPRNYYFVEASELNVATTRNDLLAKVVAHQKILESKPTQIPVTVSDIINNTVSEVAEKIALVTDYVNGILDEADNITEAAQKAVGLIQNARRFIAKSQRGIGQISTAYQVLAPLITDQSARTEAYFKNMAYIDAVKASNRQLNSSLVSMQNLFAKYVKAVPLRKHIVSQSDSLQKISVKYFGTPDNWTKIMTHNKLANTDLVVGSSLEIPRI